MAARWVWWVGIGVIVAAGGVVARGEPAPTGLNGLDRELGTTGRVGVYAPRSSTPIEPARPESDTAARAPELPPEDRAEQSESAERTATLSDEELRRTDAPVSACRIEVARRRQIAPNKLAAKEVVVRFTVDANGRVHDAEAISALGSDLEIAACAKRVLSEWVFAKHAHGVITLERTYHFH